MPGNDFLQRGGKDLDLPAIEITHRDYMVRRDRKTPLTLSPQA